MTLTDILDATSIGVRQVAIDVRKPGGDYYRQTYDLLAAFDAPSIRLLGPSLVTCIGITQDAEGKPQLYLRIDPGED